MDVITGFLYGDASENMFMWQPEDYVDPTKPGYVCKFNPLFMN